MCFAANRCSNLEGAVQFTLFVGAFSVDVFRSLALLAEGGEHCYYLKK